MISLEVWKILVDFFEKYFFEYYNFEWEVKIKIWLILLNSLKLSIQLLFFILNEINFENMQEFVLRKECEDEIYIKLDKCVIKFEWFKIFVFEVGKCIVDYIELELFIVFLDINYIIFVGEFV